MNNHKNRKYQYLFQYLFFFLLVMSIPLISQAISYFQISSILRNNATEQTMAVLQTSASTIDQVRQDVTNVVYYMSNNSEISQFLQLESIRNDKTIVSEVLKAQKQINTYKIANSYIAEIQLYASKSGIVIDSGTSGLVTETYYNAAFQINGVPYEQWVRSLLESEHSDAYFPAITGKICDRDTQCVLYAQTIPSGNTTPYSGNAFIYLDESQLLSLFHSIQYTEGGMVCVLDRDDRVLFSDNPGELSLTDLNLNDLSGTQGSFRQEVHGQTMMVLYLNSGGWTYLAVLPQEAVLAPSQGVLTFLVAMVIVSMLASGMLALYFAVKTSRPMSSITSLLMKSNQWPSPTELPGRIARLVESNEILRQTISLQMDDLRAASLYRLLCGVFHDEQEIREKFDEAQVSLNAALYCIVLVTISGWEMERPEPAQICAYKMLLNEVLSSQIHGVLGVCDLDLNRSVVLIGVGESQRESFQSQLEEEVSGISSQFSSAVEGRILFSACTAQSLIEIPSAFSYLQNWESVWGEEQELTWGSPEKKEKHQTFYYPLPVELRLIAAVQDGRNTMVEDTFELIYQQNRRCFASGGVQAVSLLQAIYGTLMRLVNECRNNKEELLHQCQMIGEMGRDVSPEERFLKTRECFIMATNSYSEGREESRTGSLAEKIKTYVEQHFTDPQISLASVAAEFHITEPYLSRVFKQSAGENFSKYVEKLRVTKAQELIRTGDMNLTRVAEQVGYNSSQVFRRAYKRVFGVSPSTDSGSPDEWN